MDPSTIAILLASLGIALGILIGGVAVWTWVADQRRWPKKKEKRR